MEVTIKVNGKMVFNRVKETYIKKDLGLNMVNSRIMF